MTSLKLPFATKAPDSPLDASADATPPAEGSSADSAGKRQLWEHDVIFAESTAMSIIEAFMVYKIVKLLCNSTPGWGGTIMACGLVLLLFAVAAYMANRLKKAKLNATDEPTKVRTTMEFETIFTCTLARILGICAVDMMTYAVVTLVPYVFGTHGVYIIAPLITAALSFHLAGAVILAMGCFLQRLHPDASKEEVHGLLHTEYAADRRPQDAQAAPGYTLFGGAKKKLAADDLLGRNVIPKDPQEVAGLGLMISVSFVAVVNLVLGEAVANISFAHSFPVCTQVVTACLTTVGLVFFWLHHILPHAAKPAATHAKEVENADKTVDEDSD